MKNILKRVIEQRTSRDLRQYYCRPYHYATLAWPEIQQTGNGGLTPTDIATKHHYAWLCRRVKNVRIRVITIAATFLQRFYQHNTT